MWQMSVAFQSLTGSTTCAAWQRLGDGLKRAHVPHVICTSGVPIEAQTQQNGDTHPLTLVFLYVRSLPWPVCARMQMAVAVKVWISVLLLLLLDLAPASQN